MKKGGRLLFWLDSDEKVFLRAVESGLTQIPENKPEPKFKPEPIWLNLQLEHASMNEVGTDAFHSCRHVHPKGKITVGSSPG